MSTPTGEPDTAPTKGANKPAPGTEYIILRLDEEGRWERIISIHASSAVYAIRNVQGLDEGTYVATPARSFNPVKLVVEQTTRVRVETTEGRKEA